MPGPLKNSRHERFAQEYVVDLNATQAYQRAGYAAKGNAAEVSAARLLRNVQVQGRISELQVERSERTKIDADWVLTRLAQEVEADVGDLYDESGALKPIREWPAIWRKGLVSGLETVKDKDGDTVVKIKLSDRARRVEMLGKHVFVSAFREQVDHTSSDGSMSPPSLADFYRDGAQAPVKADGE